MKATEGLKHKFGTNMMESVGRHRPENGFAAPLPTIHQGNPAEQGASKVKDALRIKLDRIIPDPDQPRVEFNKEKMDELVESLKEFGQQMPCLVRYEVEIDKYVIISGGRRLAAAKLLAEREPELDSLICIVNRTPLTPARILELQLVENLHRDDLKPIERAKTYQRLLELHDWTYRDLAEHCKVSLGSISDDLKLLRLPVELQSQIENGDLPLSTGAALADIDDPEQQRKFAEDAIAGRASRKDVQAAAREAKDVVRRSNTGASGKGKASASKAKKLPSERTIRLATGHKVTVSHRRGFDVLALVEALRIALETAEGMHAAEVEAGGGGAGGILNDVEISHI